MATIKYTINGLLADLTATRDNTEDKYLVPISNGTANLEQVAAHMMAVNPGLEPETLAHVLELEKRVIKELLMSGMRVNTGLFSAAASFKGAIVGGQWDTARNNIVVNFRPGTDLREAIAETHVEIITERGSLMYIAGLEDAETRATNATATAGSIFIVTGNRLKVVGTDPSVGITLTAENGTVTRITSGAISTNENKTLKFIVPATLANGEYTLRVTTQFGGGGKLLKEPQSTEKTIYIGEAPAGGEGGASGTDPYDPLEG